MMLIPQVQDFGNKIIFHSDLRGGKAQPEKAKHGEFNFKIPSVFVFLNICGLNASALKSNSSSKSIGNGTQY